MWLGGVRGAGVGQVFRDRGKGGDTGSEKGRMEGGRPKGKGWRPGLPGKGREQGMQEPGEGERIPRD